MNFQAAAEKFENAVRNKKLSTSNPSHQADALIAYGYYKQATVGAPTSAQAPSMLDFKGKQKYEAWKKVATLTKGDATKKYIAHVEACAKKYNF